MTTYTNVFGGNTIRPADVSYSTLALTSNLTLSWPGEGQGPFTSAIMEVTPNAAGRTLKLPDARNVSPGESITFKNLGADSFALQDNAGGSIVTVTTGNSFTVYLKSNATAAGSWGYWEAGSGPSSADAGALDGPGLEADSGLLRVRMVVRTYAIAQAFSNSDRGSLAVWTGGSGTFTMPGAVSVSDGWFMYFKNDGSGTLTLAAPLGETFDGESSVLLSPGQSATVASNGVNFSVMTSASTATLSDFSYAEISVAGSGTYTLNANEYAKKAIKFTGLLTGNRTIVVPDVERDYWINNATTGSYTLTVKTAAGSGVAVTQTKAATLYSDGTNVVAADTDFPSGIATPVSVANGGTGATVADTALTNLGGTTVGKQLFTAANQASARSAAGAAASGANTDITSLQLNNTGLKVRDTDASHNLSVVPGSNLSADRTLTITTGDADRTLTLSGNLTVNGATTISTAGADLIDDATAADQRTTLGLVIGTHVQAYDAELAAIAGLASAADRVPYFTGAGTAALATFTAAGRNLVDDASAADQRTTLGAAASGAVASSGVTMNTSRILGRTTAGSGAIEELTAGTGLTLSGGSLSVTTNTYQPLDSELTALAGLASAADRLPYFTGSGTAALATFTAAGRNLIDDADASAQRTTLGLGTAATLNVGTGASQVVQLNGSAQLPAVDGSLLTSLPGSMTYLGAINTSSGTSQSLGSLSLGSYSMLLLFYAGVTMNGTTTLGLGNSASDDVAVTASANNFTGFTFVDLNNGIAGSAMGSGAGGGDTPLSTGTTTITVATSNGVSSFTGGSIRVYGVK